MNDQDFFRQLYRLGGPDVDWSLLFGGPSSSRGPPPPRQAEQVKNEYLRHVLEPRSYYSVPVAKAETQDDGSVIQVEEKTFFHWMHMEHGSHRAKLVTTYADADDAARQASLALNIQYMDGRTHHSMRTEASVTVFFRQRSYMD